MTWIGNLMIATSLLALVLAWLAWLDKRKGR